MSLAQTPSKGLAHSAVCRGPLCSPPVTSPTLASAAPGAAAPAGRPGLAQGADTLLPGALGARPLRPHVFSQTSPSCAQHPHCPAPSLTPSTYHHVYRPSPPAEADLRVGQGPVCLVSVGAWNSARSRAGAQRLSGPRGRGHSGFTQTHRLGEYLRSQVRRGPRVLTGVIAGGLEGREGNVGVCG